MSECHVVALTMSEDLVEVLMSPGAPDVGLMMTGVQEGVQMMKGEGAEAWMTWGHVVETMLSLGNLWAGQVHYQFAVNARTVP